MTFNLGCHDEYKKEQSKWVNVIVLIYLQIMEVLVMIDDRSNHLMMLSLVIEVHYQIKPFSKIRISS